MARPRSTPLPQLSSLQPSCDDRYFQVIAPEFPLDRRDGVHLILIKKEEVTDRSDSS